MKLNKRAALELSITAIVVLIIAITVLGLGIGFIKKQFGAGTELVTKEFSGIKEQLRKQVKTGGELLVFSVPEQVSIGTPEAVLIGIRNTAANPEGDRICFRVEVRCLQPFTPDSQCVADQTGAVAVGGYDMESQGFVTKVKPNHNWFKSIGPGGGQFDLKNYEGEAYDASILIRGIKSDLYSMEINIYKAINDKECANADFGDRQTSLYASKTFTLNVV